MNKKSFLEIVLIVFGVILIYHKFSIEKKIKNNVNYELIELKSREEWGDASLILEEPYITLKIVKNDSDKTIVERKTKAQRYLYDIKNKRLYSGIIEENLGNEKIMYEYLNGILDVKKIYKNDELQKVEKMYRSGEIRAEILYKNGEIEKIKEY